MAEKKITLFQVMAHELKDERYLELRGIDEKEAEIFNKKNNIELMSGELEKIKDEDGRFLSTRALKIIASYLSDLADAPQEGWLAYCYNYILGRLFPPEENLTEETNQFITPEAEDKYRGGRLVLLQILKSLYDYENLTVPFNPTKEVMLLSDKEVINKGYTKEYLHMKKWLKDRYFYVFMRLGIDITPFNTLGHIGGVHYVAMFMAEQLKKLNVPIDLALISGAALCHDIGKYGCKKNEWKRVPYLHYYYTGNFCQRVDLNAIGHIAANHSVWDLELENLSVESLLLIYADFRVKSSRDEKGWEVVNFYTLKEAFAVILGKLDNVDSAKTQRYKKVYAKLADFERYMEELGVVTTFPQNFSPTPSTLGHPIHRDKALLEGNKIIDQLKFMAINHNIHLMHIFLNDDAFSNLIEAARSERLWKNVRTYIGIFREYSTYMTEHQEAMILQFLYELLSSKEGDIRRSAAALMGKIVANFDDKYTKELPEGVSLPHRHVNSLSVFAQYLDMIMYPSRHYTEQHKLWIGYCLSDFINAVLQGSNKTKLGQYLEVMEKYYSKTDYHTEQRIILFTALLDMKKKYGTDEKFLATAKRFIAEGRQAPEQNIRVEAINAQHYLFEDYSDDEYYGDIIKELQLPEKKEFVSATEGGLFLVDLKMGTHWVIKVTNIELMLHYVDEKNAPGSIMHLGMHLINLLKGSESIYVRRVAGEGLLKISQGMTYAQRNELAVELFNGLKIGDPQIAEDVPEYLGRMILKLPPLELDEFIHTMGEQILTANIPLASSMINTLGVVLENFANFTKEFSQEKKADEERQRRILYIMIRAYAHYNKELSRDAFWDMGRFIFNSTIMPMEQKDFLFLHCYKKLFIMLTENTEGNLDFYSNAAVLNHIYRYIGLHQFMQGDFLFTERSKVCFYPGTFDPFSLGHKAVAQKIRDMGFDVYLALDEFSWSKHTQPRLLRRKIMNMSVANEENIYPFPDDIPINIANPLDVKRLKEIFPGKDLYVGVGMDVIENASAYREPLTKDSIQQVNHIAFVRQGQEKSDPKMTEAEKSIKGKMVKLSLDQEAASISSTKIRDNIDLNLDISNLIDAVAQNFIYDHNLYLREPAYKQVLESLEIDIGAFKPRGAESLWPFSSKLVAKGYQVNLLDKYIERKNVWTLYIDDAGKKKAMIGYGAVHGVGTRQLLDEFQDPYVAAHIRDAAEGSIASIGFIYAADDSTIANVGQIVITELLTELIARDYSYAVYNPVDPAGYNDDIIKVLRRQGFINIAPPDAKYPLYAVNMKSPVVIFRDAETVLKNPFNKDWRVQKAFARAHNNLLTTMNKIYPGKLLLSFNTSAIHNKIIRRMADINGVSLVNDNGQERGPYMCVPFGKALSNVSVLNTVTKALHIDKYFNRAIKGFTISQTHNYSTVDNQVKTIKSFNMPVILIDDLLHKGHRMRILIPYLEKNNVDVKEVLVGVMTGRALDFLAEKHITAECAYFLPTLEVWMNERDCYPFIGGDGIDNAGNYGGYDSNPTINFVLPYVNPAFIGKNNNKAIFLYSMTCLQNAAYIMRTLQDVYQEIYEKRLTLKRLGEVFTYPRIPDIDVGVKFDENMDPVRFIENDIERLIRLQWGEVENHS